MLVKYNKANKDLNKSGKFIEYLIQQLLDEIQVATNQPEILNNEEEKYL